MTNLIELMPQRLKKPIELCRGQIRDIRMKKNLPLLVNVEGKKSFLSPFGAPTEPCNAVIVYPDEIDAVFSAACEYSVYSHEEELRNGFITIHGGHRIGICSGAVLTDGKVSSIKDISGLVIRVSHEIIGCADWLKNTILTQCGVLNTAIISPPGYGKTTLLRDIARILSENMINVCIVDERSEICAMHNGISPYNIGCCTEVLSGFPKAVGIIQAMRSLSPQVILTDEISGSMEMEAMKSGINSGISFIVTAHGKDISDLEKRGIDMSFAELAVLLYGPGRKGRIIKNENHGTCSDMDSLQLYRAL